MDRANLLHLIHPDEIELQPSTPAGDSRTRGVVRGTWFGRLIAMKKLTRDISDDLLATHAMRWRECVHPNIAGVLGISHPTAESPFVVSVYQINGNIKRHITKNPRADRRKLVFETALGMQYLHAKGLVHGGLKPTNILITENGQACVADFEMYKIQPSQNSDMHRYFSPEAWKGTVAFPSDVYAWAMCAFEICTGSLPWGVLSEKHVYQLVVYEDTRPDRPDPDGDLTDGIWSIIEECWHKDVRYRPTFDIIIRLWHETALQAQAELVRRQSALNTRPFDNANNIPPTPPMTARRREPSFSTSSVHSGPPAYEAANTKNTTTLRHTDAIADNQVISGSSSGVSFDSQGSSTIAADEPSPSYDQINFSISPIRQASLDTQSSSVADTRARSAGYNQRSFSAGPSRQTSFDTQSSGPAADIPSPSLSQNSYSSSSPPSHEGRSPLRTPRTPRTPLTSPGSPSMPSMPSMPRLSLSRRRTSSSNNPGSAIQYPRTNVPESVNEEGDTLSHFTTDLDAALPIRSDSLTLENRSEYVRRWEANQRRYSSRPSPTLSDNVSILTKSDSSTHSGISNVRSNPILLVGALQAELNGGRNAAAIDFCVAKIYHAASESDKEAHKLVTAGAVPTLIHLLKTRAADMQGLEIVLITLGTLAFDTLSSNAIYRTHTAVTLIELCKASYSEEISTLSVWCLNRICRSPEVANGLIKLKLVPVLLQQGAIGHTILPSMSLYCLGILIQTDALAELLASMDVISFIGDHLRHCTDSPHSSDEDICASLYAVARMSRSIKLAKALAKAGCVDLVAHHLHTSDNPDILHWSARAVGCLMRPNSSDMAKILLDADIARGLARLPTVLSPGDLHPLGSLGFAVQRFSCAEWSGKIRLKLVEAGVVDSLLAALRTASEEPCYGVHIELALGISLLGDVGGSAIRKEIINAGGIDILRSVSSHAAGNADVVRACNMAITSITGNLWTRNAASARTAMAHDWSGGCPDYQPSCPLVLTFDS